MTKIICLCKVSRWKQSNVSVHRAVLTCTNKGPVHCRVSYNVRSYSHNCSNASIIKRHSKIYKKNCVGKVYQLLSDYLHINIYVRAFTWLSINCQCHRLQFIYDKLNAWMHICVIIFSHLKIYQINFTILQIIQVDLHSFVLQRKERWQRGIVCQVGAINSSNFAKYKWW